MNKLQTVGLLVLITLFCPAWAQAQSKLGRVRESVRRSKPKPAAQARKEDRDDDREKKQEKQKEKKRENEQSRRQPRPRITRAIGSPFVPRINSRPPVNQVHVHETVFVTPVILDSSPITSVPQPILLPQPLGILGTAGPIENPSVPAAEETIGSAAVSSSVSTSSSQMPPVAQTVVATPESFEVSAPEVDSSVGDSYFCSPTDWFSRFTIQGGSDFDGLGQGGMGLLFQPAGSLGVEASATMFRESGMEFRDHLWLGDVNLLFEPISGDVRLRFGVGLNWLGDAYGGEAGFNMTAGTDIQLSHRWVLTGEVDYGTLGDSDLFHSQVTLGAVFDNQEVFAGYNHYDIGGAELDGVIFGLRFRF